MKKILYYGGCWDINIGNAFLDYGSLYTIKKVNPEAEIFFASELPRWFYGLHGKNMDHSVDLAEIADVDYVVVSGMVLYDKFLKLEGPIIKKLSKRGVKIVFSGCAGSTNTLEEVNRFKDFLKGINAIGFISRDSVAYNNFKDCFPISYDGLDCAFFLSESFHPLSLTIKDFVVYTFDNIPEPKIDNDRKVIRTHHNTFYFFSPSYLNIKKKNVITKYLQHSDTLISNLPDDYLSLYANTYATYTDRIHACIATLSFGNYAQLVIGSPNKTRVIILERAGANDIHKKLVKLDQDKFNQDKKNQLAILQKIFDEF